MQSTVTIILTTQEEQEKYDALGVAQRFVLTSPTFSFDGDINTLKTEYVGSTKSTHLSICSRQHGCISVTSIVRHVSRIRRQSAEGFSRNHSCMQKLIILILAIIAVIIAAMVFFMFNPLAIFQFLTGSSCASIGVTHLSERDLGRIEDNPEYQDMIILTDEDLKKAPKIQEVVRKSSSKIQFNDDYREYISYDKMEQYYQFLEEQYRQQIGFTPRQKQYGFLRV
ncbi:hypothetical protein [Candidatus Nitrosotenuis uzonensis]|uniref:Uncharacterized protein n=1 Tax=Candidatus Nitrosotenuis uzonensis TaxID=1407055 RepID=V6ARR1_9ARCH|nr:hypothetical protein [Candidatus Nitrosotenuis uzonensis]CDI05113.1 hypothetical protein NITUZ_140188 [Candidatus Nitrosotenuis uzonensis]